MSTGGGAGAGAVAGVIELRDATPGDCDLVFGWRNLPEIVALSSSRRTVTAAEHAAWFATALADADRLLLIVEVDGRPVGHIRVDGGATGTATISIYLIPGWTGRGIGVRALRQACRRAFWRGTSEIHAFVRSDNHRSVAAFTRAGFRADAIDGPVPLDHVGLVLRRDGLAAGGEAPDAARNIEHFSRLVEAHGTSAQALGWGSTASQRTRFAVLAGIGDLNGCTLADVGAGLGDLHGYLVERAISVDYTGYDLTPAMVEASRARWPGVRFEVLDILAAPHLDDAFDYVLASGVFTFHTTDSMAFLDRMVRRMYAMCRRGVAFNMLSALAPEPEPGEFVAAPDAVLRLCQAITPFVVLRHDYFPHDFSVYLRRAPA